MTALNPDIFIVDQLSAGLPLLRWLYPDGIKIGRRKRILFYCHFPDQLLATGRGGSGPLAWLKTAYRAVFDALEAWSMAAADRVVVNSHFTQGVVEGVFGSAMAANVQVVYPSVSRPRTQDSLIGPEKPHWDGPRVLLSLNRFERKKDVGLAIRAFHGVMSPRRHRTCLVIAGGYDKDVWENAAYHQELVALARSLRLSCATVYGMDAALKGLQEADVLFLPSVDDRLKQFLLRVATVLIYTPKNEHFGIVPVEAMRVGTPVLAADSGGPLETVVSGETGWLVDSQKVERWSEILTWALDDANVAELTKMGAKGMERVREKFSYEKMASELELVVHNMVNSPRSDFVEGADIVFWAGVVAVFVAALFLTLVGKNPEEKPFRKGQGGRN